MSIEPPAPTHFFIAAELQPENSASKPLHVTLTFVEDATLEEQAAIWQVYIEHCETVGFPMSVGLGNRIKVGPNNDMDACEVSFGDRQNAALKELYVKTHRRSKGAFPELTLHTTFNNPAKLATFKAHTDVALIRRLYAATTGGKKEVLRELKNPV